MARPQPARQSISLLILPTDDEATKPPASAPMCWAIACPHAIPAGSPRHAGGSLPYACMPSIWIRQVSVCATLRQNCSTRTPGPCPTICGAIPPCVPWPAPCVTKAARLFMADISHCWTASDHPHFRPYPAPHYAFGVEEFAHVISSTPRPPLSRQPPLTGPASPQEQAASTGRLS